MHVLHLRGYGDELGDGYYGDGFYSISPTGGSSLCAELHSNTYPPYSNRYLNYYTNDGSFIRVEVDTLTWLSYRAFFPDGHIVEGLADQVQKITDANVMRLFLSDLFGRRIPIFPLPRFPIMLAAQ